MRDCAQISFGSTYSHISSVRSSVRMGPMRLCFFFVLLTKICPSHFDFSQLLAVDCSCIPPLLPGVFRVTSRSRNLCSRGPRGLKFFMHSHPLMGGRPPKFQQKIRRKIFFLVLLVPLTIRLVTSVLRVLGT